MKKTLIQIIKAFIPPGIVFLFHVLMILGLNFYSVWPDFDIIMHFAGGFAIGMTGVNLLNLAERQVWLKQNSKIVSLLLSVCFVALMATLWEFAEWMADHYLQTFMQAGLDDTMFDMFLGLTGGLLSSTIFVIRKKF